MAPVRTQNDKCESVAFLSTTKCLLHIGKRICGWLEQSALYGQVLYTLHRLQYESCDEVRAPLKRITALLTTAMALLLLPALALTDESTTLQAIMQGLRDNLVEIADGLLNEDLELVERGATGIATHPRIPPEQVQLVARELGEEMPALKLD